MLTQGVSGVIFWFATASIMMTAWLEKSDDGAVGKQKALYIILSTRITNECSVLKEFNDNKISPSFRSL